MAYVLRPIDQWPGKLRADHDRLTSPFSASWNTTLVLLDKEARQLGCDEVVVQVAIEGRHFRQDGDLRSGAPNPVHPGVIVSIDAAVGPLRFSTDLHRDAYLRGYLPGWQANVRAIALGLEALRRVDRYGIGTGAEQYVGWNALPPARPMGAAMTKDEAARILIQWGDPHEDPANESAIADVIRDESFVQDLFRAAATATHPDRGGDPEVFRRVAAARDLLLGRAS